MTGDPSDPSNASAPPDLGAFELDFPEPEPVPAAREEDAVASPGLDAIELPEGDDEDSWGALPDLELEDIGPPPAASPVAPAPAAAPPPAASVAASTATSRVAEPMEQPTIETRAARLWVEDCAYAERTYALRHADGGRAQPPSGSDAMKPRGGIE